VAGHNGTGKDGCRTKNLIMTEETFQLVADIGGTNIRFACVRMEEDEILNIAYFQCEDFPQLEDAIAAYLNTIPAHRMTRICLAVAGPVTDDKVALTNNPWTFSKKDLQKKLGVEVLIINDFSAQAYCLDLLKPQELEWLGSPRPSGKNLRVVIGPGTGLGVAGMTARGEVIPTEGGHISFAPQNPHEITLLQELWKQHPHLSIEHLLSGPGLCNIYSANNPGANLGAEMTPADITTRAMDGDKKCVQTVKDFLAILAAVAGDFALAMGALDGVYVTGGILPRISSLIDKKLFRKNFTAKGQFETYCAKIPLAFITADNPGLRGCIGALRRS
jgi:glucokinase